MTNTLRLRFNPMLCASRGLTALLLGTLAGCAHHTTKPASPSAVHPMSPASQPSSAPTTAGTAPTRGKVEAAVSPPTRPTKAQSQAARAASQPARAELAKIVRCGTPSSPQVALTFDDGPYRSRGQTERVLAVLKAKKVKATFFVLGRLARRHPALLRKIADQGHLLASHSWDHPKRQSRDGWISQLKRTEAAMRRAGVTPSRYYRPPHGITNRLVRRVCGELGYTIVLYTLLSSDWRRPGVPKLVRQVIQRLKRGGIVVLHDGGGNRQQTIDALPGIIDGLRAKGLEPVRLDRLLESGSKAKGCP